VEETEMKRSLDELIARSSIGAALHDVKTRGIDAHLADLERQIRPRRRRPREADWIRQAHTWTCSMVAALNAARWWGLPSIPSQDSAAWRRWIDRCGARHGAATRVDLLHRHLGLAAIAIVPEAHAIEDALGQGVPVETTTWFPSVGLHAILLVPSRDASGESCAVALGMIREDKASKKPDYVRMRTSVDRLIADHCFPIGNPNRRFWALVPTRRRKP
jgi:hypothetical protein